MRCRDKRLRRDSEIHRFQRFSSTLHWQEAALTCQDMIIPNWEKKTDRCALRMLIAINLLRYSAVQKNSMYYHAHDAAAARQHAALRHSYIGRRRDLPACCKLVAI